MRTLPVFGIVRQMKLVGTHPIHAVLRSRNETRLAELKQRGTLTETKEQHQK